MFGQMLENVRRKKPLIQSMTNVVTINDCANVLIAAGASPYMSDCAEEAYDSQKVADGLEINIGSIETPKVEAYIAGGKAANKLGHPVVLDPVGAGVTKLRDETLKKLFNEVKISVVRGNLSEIKSLATGSANTGGVDAQAGDSMNDENIEDVVKLAKNLAKKTGAVIVITGETDVVANSDKAYIIKNGDELMSKITGSGCQLSALTAAYAAANKENMTEAVAACVAGFGLCGELAKTRMKELDGNASYRTYLIDAVYNLTAEQLERGAKYEIC